jgi:hypothetical protein
MCELAMRRYALYSIHNTVHLLYYEVLHACNIAVLSAIGHWQSAAHILIYSDADCTSEYVHELLLLSSAVGARILAERTEV